MPYASSDALSSAGDKFHLTSNSKSEPAFCQSLFRYRCISSSFINGIMLNSGVSHLEKCSRHTHPDKLSLFLMIQEQHKKMSYLLKK